MARPTDKQKNEPSSVQGTLMAPGRTEAKRRLRVEAWDRDRHAERPYGTANVGPNEAFRIALDPDALQAAEAEQLPAIYFKVFDGKTLLFSTHDSLAVAPGATGIVLELDPVRHEAPAAPPELPVEAPVAAPAPAPVLTKALAGSVALPPRKLKAALTAAGITTLDGVRSAGGLRRIPAVAAAGGADMLGRLEAHADLSRYAGITTVAIDRMVDNGYRSTSDVAAAPRSEFVKGASPDVGDFPASRIHTSAVAQRRFLDNVLMANWAGRASYRNPDLNLPLVDDQAWPACECRDCQTAVSPLAYVADLLDYSVDHVRDGGAAITPQFLEQTFLQPFARLPASCEQMDTTVRQVRICIEVLRRYLAGLAPAGPVQAALDRAEADYRLAAYQAILVRLGTSYEEIRLARGLDPAVPKDRQALDALTDRLGFDPVGAAPTILDALFLDPTAVPVVLTEAALESLFGLVDTTRDPLAPGVQSRVEAARLAHLRTLREAADRPATAAPELPPLIDPDVIGTGHLVSPMAPDPAFALWDARRAWVDGRLTAMKATREAASGAPGGNPSAGLEAITQLVLGQSLAQLDVLRTQQLNGEDITAGLAALALSAETFGVLTRLARLAAAPAGTPVLEEEWQEGYAILTQVEKVSQFATWRGEEAAAGLVLDGERFRIPPVDTSVFPPAALPAPRAWLATREARRDWEERLQSRLDQGRDAIQALADAIGGVEGDHLPALRDALILATDFPGTGLSEKAKAATAALLIDAKMSGCQITTRIAQAIETLQGLLFALRNALLSGTYPALTLDADDFDEEWTVIGSYASWKGVMLVCAYPETVLYPALHFHQSGAFRKLVSALRNNRRLTADQACEAGKTYERYFRDVCSLRIEATCQTRTRMHAGDCRSKYETGYRCLLYLVARAVSGTVYWSCYDPEDPTGYAQTPWEPVPGLPNVTAVCGAAVYAMGPEERAIYLICQATEKAKRKLVVAQYDLEKQRWGEEPTELEPPDDEVPFTAVVRQSRNEGIAPYVVIRLATGLTYGRRLNRDATDWETEKTKGKDDDDSGSEDWVPLITRRRGADFQEILAVIEIDATSTCLFARSHGWITYRLDGPRGDGTWRLCAKAAWRGLVRFGGDDLLYVLYGTGAATSARALDLDVAPLEIVDVEDIWSLEVHLATRFGLRLRNVHLPADVAKGVSLYQYLTVTMASKSADFLFAGLQNHIASLMRAQAIQWLAKKLEDTDDFTDPEFGDWKFAQQEFRKFSTTGASLTDALQTLSGGGTVRLRRRRFGADGVGSPFGVAAQEIQVAPVGGAVAGKGEAWRYAFQGTGPQSGPFQCYFDRAGGTIILREPVPLAPHVTGPFDITERLSDDALQVRRGLIQAAFADNAGSPASNMMYLEEAWWGVPCHLAIQLQTRGQYTPALDWLRTTYDYSAPAGERKIYHGLKAEETLAAGFARAADWLLDPINPHAVAATRANTHTRFTLFTIIRCLLDYADAEFTRDTPESVPRARAMYQAVLGLIDSSELQPATECDAVIGTLTISVGDPNWASAFIDITRDLRRVADPRILATAVANVNRVMATAGTLAEKYVAARAAVAAANPPQAAPTLEALVAEKRARIALARQAVLAHPDVAAAVERVSAAAGRDHAAAVSMVTGVTTRVLATPAASLPWLAQPASVGAAMAVAVPPAGMAAAAAAPAATAAALHLTLRHPVAGVSLAHTTRLHEIALAMPQRAVKIVRHFPGGYVPAPSYRFCIPPNPMLAGLRLRAELNLYKIRSCRNIAGIERQLELYAAPTDVASGMPMIGAGGQLMVGGATTYRPTPYRYAAIVERAKQLVSYAQQVESALLSALEKRDAEYYTLLKARQDLRLGRSGIRLQDLRIREAEGGVKLAELQEERAQLQVDHYKGLLAEGVSGLEVASLGLMQTVVGLYGAASIMSAIPNIIAGMAGGAIVDWGGIMSNLAQALSTQANVLSTLASYERRAEEWEFQRTLAQQDVRIGVQQVRVAEDRVRIVGQERMIAELQAEHAETVVDFLANKFSNVELYDWMSGILERAYASFLQHATATAQLAASQLAFERQETAPPIIQADYWEAPSDSPMPGGGAPGPDRRGITGSTRLLQDLVQLDQFAFETNRRKLQPTRTFSLARLMPAEFQRFRETGVLRFSTPMELFDRETPGHVGRLIQRVRVSVLALIPPTQGIRATLSNLGTSRVVIGPDLFRTIVVRRDPESIFLSSPRESNGLFELEPQQHPELMAPFQGLGVDTSWEFRMPRAANFFDYRTLVDVSLTMDYCATDSPIYREQVIADMGTTLHAERPFSFRHQFADRWYDLHNPDRTATPMTVTFETRREDFPANLEAVKIEHVILYCARKSGSAAELVVTDFLFTPAGGAPVGGPGTTVDGVISTRRGNGGGWAVMIGQAAAGQWELRLPNDAATRNLFQQEIIEDIMLVVAYTARTPSWPS